MGLSHPGNQNVRRFRSGVNPAPYGNGFNNTGEDEPRPYEGCCFIRQILQNAKIPRRGGLYALPKNEALCPPFFGSPASGALLRSESPHPSFPRRPESPHPSFPRRSESPCPSFPRRSESTLPSFPCRSEFPRRHSLADRNPPSRHSGMFLAGIQSVFSDQ